MVRALLVVWRAVRAAWLVELVGAGLVTAGAYEAWGTGAGLAVAGAALLLKSYDLDGER